MSTPYSAIVEMKLYVGGGLTVTEYHPQEDKWLNLEQYQYQWFAMAALNNKLTLVGCMDPSTRQVTIRLPCGNEGCILPVDPPIPEHAITSLLTSCSHIQMVSGGGRWA